MLLDVARKTEGFSGRGISKLLLNVQGAVYSEPECCLTPKILSQVLKQELVKHRARMNRNDDTWHGLGGSPVRSGVRGGGPLSPSRPTVGFTT